MPAPRRNGLSHPPLPEQLKAVNLNAAAIDIGATFHMVAVPPDRDDQPVRAFSAFTADLHRLADWLEHCGIDTVAMESTGNYWIPLFELLENRGFDVCLTDPRRLKRVPGRKSDVQDCQWGQQLHTYGLLSKAFRPPEAIVTVRSYVRQRAKLVRSAATQILAMQNALTLMNLKLQHVVNDVTGVTGLAIIRAILAGERDPYVLAQHRDYRCKNDLATITASLVGNWREDDLFLLRQAVDSYDHFQCQIDDCDATINATLAAFDSVADPADLPPDKPTRKRDRKSFPGDLRAEVFRITGVDLFAINGLNDLTILTLLSEVGTDMSPWPTAKHFASWLSLCPANDVSGGKVLRRGTRPNASRAALAFRLAASSLHRSHSALGAFFRRKKAQLGTPKALTATAHKIARAYYNALRYGNEYVDAGEEFYQERYRQHQLKIARRMADRLGLQLVPKTIAPHQPALSAAPMTT
jgi:transposase